MLPSINWKVGHTLVQYLQSSASDPSVYGSDTVCHLHQDPAYAQPMHLPVHADVRKQT